MIEAALFGLCKEDVNWDKNLLKLAHFIGNLQMKERKDKTKCYNLKAK